MSRYTTLNLLIAALFAGIVTTMPVAANIGNEADTTSRRRGSLSFCISGGSAHLLRDTEENSARIDGHLGAYYGINATWSTPRDPNHLSDRAFGYPSLDFGMTVTDFSATRFFRLNRPRTYRSRLGREYTLYGAFRRDIVRTARQSFG